MRKSLYFPFYSHYRLPQRAENNRLKPQVDSGVYRVVGRVLELKKTASMSLTAIKVAKVTKSGRYGDGHGLYLQVSSTGVKSWLLRYVRHARERWMGLGPLHTVSLKEARERARRARQQLLDGTDPLDARKAQRAAQALQTARLLTFEEATRQYFDAHEKKWRNAKHRAQFLSTLRAYAFPKIGKLPLADVDLGLVLKVIEPIWRDKTETVNRVRVVLKACWIGRPFAVTAQVKTQPVGAGTFSTFYRRAGALLDSIITLLCPMPTFPPSCWR